MKPYLSQLLCVRIEVSCLLLYQLGITTLSSLTHLHHRGGGIGIQVREMVDHGTAELGRGDKGGEGGEDWRRERDGTHM